MNPIYENNVFNIFCQTCSYIQICALNLIEIRKKKGIAKNTPKTANYFPRDTFQEQIDIRTSRLCAYLHCKIHMLWATQPNLVFITSPNCCREDGYKFG